MSPVPSISYCIQICINPTSTAFISNFMCCAGRNVCLLIFQPKFEHIYVLSSFRMNISHHLYLAVQAEPRAFIHTWKKKNTLTAHSMQTLWRDATLYQSWFYHNSIHLFYSSTISDRPCCAAKWPRFLLSSCPLLLSWKHLAHYRYKAQKDPQLETGLVEERAAAGSDLMPRNVRWTRWWSSHATVSDFCVHQVFVLMWTSKKKTVHEQH